MTPERAVVERIAVDIVRSINERAGEPLAYFEVSRRDFESVHTWAQHQSAYGPVASADLPRPNYLILGTPVCPCVD